MLVLYGWSVVRSLEDSNELLLALVAVPVSVIHTKVGNRIGGGSSRGDHRFCKIGRNGDYRSESKFTERKVRKSVFVTFSFALSLSFPQAISDHFAIN